MRKGVHFSKITAYRHPPLFLQPFDTLAFAVAVGATAATATATAAVTARYPAIVLHRSCIVSCMKTVHK